MKPLKIITLVGQLVFVLLFNYHALHSKQGDNQTGLDMKFAGAIFLAFAAGVFLISQIKSKFKGKMDKLTLVIIGVFILISANFFLFDYFNIMVEYNTWLGRGMPAKPFWF